jgi:hypothetical protein
MSRENLNVKYNTLQIEDLTHFEMEDINGGGWFEVIAAAIVSSVGLVFAIGTAVGFVVEKNLK